MKKLIILISILTFGSLPTFAECNYLNQCSKYSPSGFSKANQFFSNTTGLTALAENFADNIIQQQLEKSTGQKFNIDLKAFSLSELLDGKFKSLTVTGNNINLEGIYLSSLKVQTLCDFNHVDIHSRPFNLKENMVLGFWADVSEQDLKNIFSNPKYLNKMSKIDLSKAGVKSFRIDPSTIAINGGLLYATINADITGQMKPIDIAVALDIVIKNEKVVISKISLVNLFLPFNLSQFPDIFNPLNYLNFPINLYGNTQAEVQVVDLGVSGDKISIYGMIFLPKNN